MIMINNFKIGDKLLFYNLFCARMESKNFVYSRHTRFSTISYISSDYVISDFGESYLVVLSFSDFL
jgi:hypothetical protein